VEQDAHIGNIYLRDIDFISGRGELHILIGEPGERGKGYGSGAVRLLVDYAVKDLGLKRVWLNVLADNKPAIRLYEIIGFKIEGRLRNHVFKAGKFRDLLVMGILAEDYPPSSAGLVE
jgi:RimJ/RimL family protein N-acetyltransferase